ncbi:MAG: GNAT family N-acetyltransferase [Desulfosalsimonas sp.]
MKANNRDKYRAFCDAEKGIPVFSRPWWLDAVCGPNAWDVALVKSGGRVAASMPYVIRKTKGLKQISMPRLTQALGPYLTPSNAKYAKQLAREKDLMEELIAQLPAFDRFAQNFHYRITNWLPFYWQGFFQTTRYTYVIEDLSDLDVLWRNFQENIRRECRKANKMVQVQSTPDPSEFYRVNALTFHHQGRKIPYSYDYFSRLDTACAEQKARRMFFAKDKDQRIHAAVYIVWDENSAYYLMGGADPELRNSGANSLLMWEAIKFAASVTRKFDFEGSMIESVERFFRAFGARQTPYFHVTKAGPRMKILQAGWDLAKAVSGLVRK